MQKQINFSEVFQVILSIIFAYCFYKLAPVAMYSGGGGWFIDEPNPTMSKLLYIASVVYLVNIYFVIKKSKAFGEVISLPITLSGFILLVVALLEYLFF